MLNKLKKELKTKADPKRAEVLQRFFKTGKGEYGEGQVFLGVVVPKLRKIAKDFESLSLFDIKKLLSSKIHEERFVALVLLVSKYQKAKLSNPTAQERIFDFYIKNAKKINNWDLVDVSSHKIVGDFLIDKDKSILYKLAKSENLWEKRIAIVSAYAFIKKGDLKDVFKISEILLEDKHDLIHKAVGWMLREAGKKDQKKLEMFLKKHYKKMSRTTLRYAIEMFDCEKRKIFLNMNF